MAKKHLQHRVTDTKDLLRRYRRATKGETIEGLDDVFTTYRMRRKIHTRLVEAPFKIVVYFAFFNAIGINILKYSYFYVFGKPQVFMTPEQYQHREQASRLLAEMRKEASASDDSGITTSDSHTKLMLLEKRLAESGK